MTGSASVAFGGASSILTAQTPLNATSNWTLEGWIYPANINQNALAVYAGDEGGQGGDRERLRLRDHHRQLRR